MKHDPEKVAASYLQGDMKGRRRVHFEEHIVECEQCWREVRLGRAGRALAESARELAPQNTREKVRAVIAASPPPPHEWLPRRGAALIAMVALFLALASVGYVSSRREEQPAVIEAVLADYTQPIALHSTDEAELPEQVANFAYAGSYATRVESLEVRAYAYRSSTGHKVVVYQANETFPTAGGAEYSSDHRTWSAAIDGVVLFCADDPVPSLVLGRDAEEVALVVAELGLR